MTRAFFALPLPERFRTDCIVAQAGIRSGRLVAAENLHVTLVFLGDLDDRMLEEAHFAAEALRCGPVLLGLSEMGVFGSKSPRAIYAGIAPDPGLVALQSKLETAMRRIGIPVPKRRFVPHITLARLKGQAEDAGPVHEVLTRHRGFDRSEVQARFFGLFESRLYPDGPVYEELASYPLT